jgi:hypothetical protein
MATLSRSAPSSWWPVAYYCTDQATDPRRGPRATTGNDTREARSAGATGSAESPPRTRFQTPDAQDWTATAACSCLRPTQRQQRERLECLALRRRAQNGAELRAPHPTRSRCCSGISLMSPPSIAASVTRSPLPRRKSVGTRRSSRRARVSRGIGPRQQVAPHHHAVDPLATNLLEHGFQRREVPMDVVEGSDTHDGGSTSPEGHRLPALQQRDDHFALVNSGPEVPHRFGQLT